MISASRILIRLVMIIAAVALLPGCEATGKNVAGGSGDSDSNNDNSCEEGTFDCVGLDYVQCVDGVWVVVETCEEVCVSYLGCVECQPGDAYCEGDLVMTCDQDGMGYSMSQDCAELGTVCIDGACFFADPCDAAMATSSNIGCEYWAADLDNAENDLAGLPISLPGFEGDDAAAGIFAVAVANIGSNGTAHVEVHINDADQGSPLELSLVNSQNIEEGALYTFELPRRDVDGEPITLHIDDGPQTWLSSRAFRITSDVPVVAYQFNTLDQQFSNDASLLLPTSALGKDHLVVGYSPSGPMGNIGPLPGPKNRGYVTVLGTEETTNVWVTPSYDIVAGEGIDEILAGETALFTIGPFDVINLETRFMTLFGDTLPDLTGTTVESDKPVAVFFGTDLAMVQTEDTGDEDDSCCAEHLEQQIIPSKAMGQNFVVSHSATRNNTGLEPELYRIMSYQGATVTTNLPAPNNAFSLGPGEYQEFFVNNGFTLSTDDGYLHVAQYLVVGTETQKGIGDSSLLYVPAVDQRRGLYVFTTGQGFASNHAVVSAPEGTPLTLQTGTATYDVTSTCDGPLSDGQLDGVDYEAWTCEIPDGTHTIYSGNSPEGNGPDIGVFVYGYYNAGSYAYPAGSDMKHINPVVIE